MGIGANLMSIRAYIALYAAWIGSSLYLVLRDIGVRRHKVAVSFVIAVLAGGAALKMEAQIALAMGREPLGNRYVHCRSMKTPEGKSPPVIEFGVRHFAIGPNVIAFVGFDRDMPSDDFDWWFAAPGVDHIDKRLQFQIVPMVSFPKTSNPPGMMLKLPSGYVTPDLSVYIEYKGAESITIQHLLFLHGDEAVKPRPSADVLVDCDGP